MSRKNVKHGDTERKDEGGRMRDEIGKCISSSFILSLIHCLI